MKYKEPKTIRGNGKWSKITHLARGKYYVARGYDGEPHARYGDYCANRDNAAIVAKNWLEY